MMLRFDHPMGAVILLDDPASFRTLPAGWDGWTEHWRKLTPTLAEETLERQPDGRETETILRRFLGDEQGSAAANRLEPSDLRRAAAQRIGHGWLVEVVRAAPSGWSTKTQPPKVAAEAATEAVPPPENPTGVPEKKEKDHFIVVELVGENGEPIPNELCRLTLPDGQVVERETDSRGRVEENNIPGGDCTVEFPDLDKDAWEAVNDGE